MLLLSKKDHETLRWLPQLRGKTFFIATLTDYNHNITQGREVPVLKKKTKMELVGKSYQCKSRTRNHSQLTIENFLAHITSTSSPNVIAMS